MKRPLSFTLLVLHLTFSCGTPEGIPKEKGENNTFTVLFMGDSYTVGESVDRENSFPYQTYHLLNKKKKRFDSPEVVAKTGWTTDEMLKGLEKANLDATFDFVTLCIGVNDQFRGRLPSDFIKSFQKCLTTAIGYASGNKDHVIVLSIPDWGVTPFAKKGNYDQPKVELEIDAYNAIKDSICQANGVNYIEITNHFRKFGALEGSYAKDGLHPSKSIYSHWSQEVSKVILKEVK